MNSPTPHDLSVVITRTTGSVLSDESVSTVLDLLVAVALDTIPGADACGVTLVDEVTGRGTTAASDALAERADEVQYELREGPCFTAWRTRARTVVADVRTDGRWPRWAEAMGVLGLRSVLSAPMVAGDRAVGAVKVYARAPHAFDVRSERVLSLYGAQAAVLVAGLEAADRGRLLSADLGAALRSRDTISTARGVLMQRCGVDEHEAFTLLAAMAADEGRPLHLTARRLVDAAVRGRP